MLPGTASTGSIYSISGFGTAHTAFTIIALAAFRGFVLHYCCELTACKHSAVRYCGHPQYFEASYIADTKVVAVNSAVRLLTHTASTLVVLNTRNSLNTPSIIGVRMKYTGGNCAIHPRSWLGLGSSALF